MKHLLTLTLSLLLLAFSANASTKYHDSLSHIDKSSAINDDRTEAREILAKDIQQYNAKLPEEVGEGFVVNAVKIEGNYIVFTFTLDLGGEIPFEMLSIMEKEMKQVMLESFFKSFDGMDKQILAVAGLGLKATFKDKNSKATHTIRIDPNEIVMGATAQTMTQISKQQALYILETVVKESQKEMDANEGTLSLSENCLTFTFYLEEEDKAEMEEVKQLYQRMSSQQLMEEFGIEKEMAEVCKAAEINIEVVYIDAQNQNYIEFVIPYKDM